MNHVVSHYPCTDGFAAAYVAWTVMPDATFHQYSHGSAWPVIVGGDADQVWFLDLAPPEDVVQSLLVQGLTVRVLDHHKTAIEQWTGPYSALKEQYPSMFHYWFIDEYSGAEMTWLYLRGSDVHGLIRYIADRDLWRWKLPNSREVNAFLNTIPVGFTEANFDKFAAAMRDPIGSQIEIGKALLAVENQHVSMLLQDTMVGTCMTCWDTPIYEVPVVNCPAFFASEVGHRLLAKFPDAPFSATFREVGTGDRRWSLRSEDSRVNVSQVAQQLGGGGHRNASGFTDHVNNPKIILKLY